LWSGPSTNLDRIGFKIALFPIKVEKASGAWIRAAAIVAGTAALILGR